MDHQELKAEIEKAARAVIANEYLAMLEADRMAIAAALALAAQSTANPVKTLQDVQNQIITHTLPMNLTHAPMEFGTKFRTRLGHVFNFAIEAVKPKS